MQIKHFALELAKEFGHAVVVVSFATGIHVWMAEEAAHATGLKLVRVEEHRTMVEADRAMNIGMVFEEDIHGRR